MHPSDTWPCFQAHLGLWAIEEMRFRQAIEALRHDRLPLYQLPPTLDRCAHAFAEASFQHFWALNSQVERRKDALYSQLDDVALIRLVDQMTKTPSKFGGTSTVLTRRAIRQALSAEDINSLLLAVDSPGGMVAGTMELADEVLAATYSKPVAAFYEDMAASAAVWGTVYAQRITATRMTQVGSIGVFAEVVDSSGAAEREGLKVYIRSTGAFKGLGAPGTEVPPELLSEIDQLVQGMGEQFFAAVRVGRNMGPQKLAAVTTGQVWLAPKAQELGLIDGVETFEQAVVAASKMRPRRRREQSEQLTQDIAARQAHFARVFSPTEALESAERTLSATS